MSFTSSRRASVPGPALLLLACAVSCADGTQGPPRPCAAASEAVPVGVTPTATSAVCPDPPNVFSTQFEGQLATTQAAADATRTALLDPTVITVVTCGTGTPIPSARAQACTAVFANGLFLLFDSGDGAQRSMETLQLPVVDLDAVFLTHFHSDHVADVGEVISRSWILGRRGSLPIHGGPGIDRVVDGFNLIYSLDDAYRSAHHGAAVFPPDSSGAHAVEIPDPGAAGTVVFSAQGVTVRAFVVNHAPVEPAYGYRVEFGGRSVVISGDTTDTASLHAMSQGADVLVSEVMNKSFVEAGECAFGRVGDATREAIFRDIRSYHIDVSELATLAETAGVAHLVLTHQVPSVDDPTVQNFLFGVPTSAIYGGDVVLAVDGSRVTVPVP